MTPRWLCLALVLEACAFDVQLGEQRDASVVGFSHADAGNLVSLPRALRYRLSIPAQSLEGCQLDGGVTMLPAESFEVLLLEPVGGRAATLAVAGLGPLRLGDAPEIVVGDAFEGTERHFEWVRERASRATPTGPLETRLTLAVFDFDRLDTLETGGSLSLAASWACAQQQGPCLEPADRGACSVVRRFRASQLSQPALWHTAEPEALEGARRALVSLDLGALSRGEMSCTHARSTLVRERTPHLRALGVWQFRRDHLRIPRLRIETEAFLPVVLGPDLPGYRGRWEQALPVGPLSFEAVVARVEAGRLPEPGQPGEPTTLRVALEETCGGQSCAPVNACDVTLAWDAFEVE